MNTVNSVIELKKTPLHAWHVANGAKMGAFGEWEMPLSYGSEMKEWRAVREKAGLFDVSHMKVLSVWSPLSDVLKYHLQLATTNDVSRLKDGDVQYTLICDKNGGILEDTTLYKISEGNFFFVINANNAKKIQDYLCWMTGLIFNDKNDMSIFALQGPSAEEILSHIVQKSQIPQKRYTFNKALLNALIISRTGYTGEDGFELFCANDRAEELWEMLLSAGKPFGLLPSGLIARDMLRTEAGMRLYGNDIDETTNPIEAGLEKYVCFEKGDFVGKAAIEKALALKNRGSGRFFTGFIMDAKPEHGCPIFENSLVPDEIGTITSATYSPLLKKRIALGHLRERKNPGEVVYVKIGEDYRPAVVTALPFYSRKK